MGKDIQKWSDSAMFSSKPLDAGEGPRVFLLCAPADPLGSVAAAAKMYLGEVVRDLAEVSDEERISYLRDMERTKLAMPLETVQFHFLIEGVSRAFTHQMVRQRTAAYAQESMRFAVVEDEFASRVTLPPSLANTTGEANVIRFDIAERHGFLTKYATLDDGSREVTAAWKEWEAALDRLSQAERWRYKWDLALDSLQRTYKALIDDGMPAEDARGLLPTNIATRIHYVTNLRGLLDHAGNRLCTQAQFEWRVVLAKVAKAIREYGAGQNYPARSEDESGSYTTKRHSAWQFEAIADLLKPVCYQQNRCPMQASFDRKCSIRERVERNAAIGRPSNLWHTSNEAHAGGEVEAIQPYEWLADPSAAR